MSMTGGFWFLPRLVPGLWQPQQVIKLLQKGSNSQRLYLSAMQGLSWAHGGTWFSKRGVINPGCAFSLPINRQEAQEIMIFSTNVLIKL